MANYAGATFSVDFSVAWLAIDAEFKNFLVDKKFDVPATWAHVVPRRIIENGDVEGHLRSLLGGLGAGPNLEAWLLSARRLWQAACGDAKGLAQRVGSLSGLQLTEDAATRRRARVFADEAKDLRRLHAAALATLPLEWRGKRYRRQERLNNEGERADAEAAERKHWGREVAGLLAEAQLPFAKTLGDAAPDSAVALRCCRGLRAHTLKQRVSCWRPLRRWLLHSGYPPFPTVAQHFLGYLEVKAGEGASRTTAASLLSALRFLEEAGEVRAENRLSLDPALTNTAKEAKVTGSSEAGQEEGPSAADAARGAGGARGPGG